MLASFPKLRDPCLQIPGRGLFGLLSLVQCLLIRGLLRRASNPGINSAPQIVRTTTHAAKNIHEGRRGSTRRDHIYFARIVDDGKT